MASPPSTLASQASDASLDEDLRFDVAWAAGHEPEELFGQGVHTIAVDLHEDDPLIADQQDQISTLGHTDAGDESDNGFGDDLLLEDDKGFLRSPVVEEAPDKAGHDDQAPQSGTKRRWVLDSSDDEDSSHELGEAEETSKKNDCQGTGVAPQHLIPN